MVLAATLSLLFGLLPTGGLAAAGAPHGELDPALRDAARVLEDEITDNLWYGQIYSAVFRTPERNPGEVVGLYVFGDSGLWSGVYLAGESYRYAVLRHQMETAPNEGLRRAAEVELGKVKQRIDELTDAVHLRVNIARNWKANDDSKPTGRGYGDGLADGEEGVLFRTCLPAGFPMLDQDPATRGENWFGPLTWDGKLLAWEAPGTERAYFCEDDTSRDAYIGTVYGLLTAFDRVGPHDEALRAQLRDDILDMVDYLVRHGWSVVYPYSRSDSGSEISFNQGVVPLFVNTPQARLRMAQAARHVARQAGSVQDQAKWEAIWSSELAAMGPHYQSESVVAVQNPHSAYYGFNLNHLNSFDLISHESDAVARELFRRGLSVIDATTGDDLNAHFETIVYALTGEAGKRDAAEQHLREWLDYRANSFAPMVNSTRCGTELACIPDDEIRYEQPTPLGPQTVAQQGTSSRVRAAEPLPIARRRATDFLWQRSPYYLDGHGDPRELHPAVDFLSPYWMLRYFTEVAPPTVDPLPVWEGIRSK